MNKEIFLKEKGITLVALAVTIIVLLILAGVSVKVGLSSIRESKSTAMLSEVEMVQHAVLEAYTKEATYGDGTFPGTQKYTSIDEIKNELTELSDDAKLMQILSNTEDYVSDYYYLEKADLEELGITNADDNYIVNYKLGIVIDVTNQRTGDGDPVYTYAKDGTE